MAKPFLFKKKAKMVLFPEKRMELDPQADIYMKQYHQWNIITYLYGQKPKIILLPGLRIELDRQVHIYIQNQCHQGNNISTSMEI